LRAVWDRLIDQKSHGFRVHARNHGFFYMKKHTRPYLKTAGFITAEIKNIEIAAAFGGRRLPARYHREAARIFQVAERALYSGFDLKQCHCFKSAGAARIRAMRGNPL
jgi:hypothetical protein